MDTGNQAQLEVLGWIVIGALAVVIAAVVALIRSGRAVSLPLIRWRSPLTGRKPVARREGRPGAAPGGRSGAAATREGTSRRGRHAHPVSR